jgi:hypothetical protein
VEETLCKIWQELLGIERVGVNDNFSLSWEGIPILTMQVVSRANRLGYSFNLKISLFIQAIGRASRVLAGRSTAGIAAEQGCNRFQVACCLFSNDMARRG